MLHKMTFPQVTFDVSWSPHCIAQRCYNYTAIADACDFLFVMSYDERSLPWSKCIAGANSPYTQTLTGKNSQNDHLSVILLGYYFYNSKYILVFHFSFAMLS